VKTIKTARFLVSLALALGLGLVLGLLTLLRVEAPAARANNVFLVRPPDVGCGAFLNCRTSVQAALHIAGDGDEIHVATGTYTDAGGTVAVITKTVWLQGGWDLDFTEQDPEAYPTTLDGQGLGQVVAITGATSAPTISPTIEGFRITGGDAALAPGYQAGRGGGVFAYRADPRLLGNTIWGNTATSSGTGEGGGVFVEQAAGSSVISGNVIYSNTAAVGQPGVGGGIGTRFAEMILVNNHVLSNTACVTHGDGGGVHVLAGAVTVTGNLIRGNVASVNGNGNGGGINFSYGRHRLVNNQILSNTASLGTSANAGAGGVGVATYVLIQDNVIAYNRAGVGATANEGGGINLGGSEPVTVTGNLIAHNVCGPTAGHGGGLSVHLAGSIIDDNRILDNVAAETGWGEGGGIWIDTPTVTVRANLVQGNVAGVSGDVRGGGLYAWRYAGLVVEANRFFSNTALEGGGLMLHSVAFTVANNFVAANQATTGAGIRVTGDGTNPDSDGCLYHNTVAGHAGQGVAVGDHATVIAANNILADNTVGITLTGSVSATLGHNSTLFWPDDSGSFAGMEPTPRIGDPAFVDAARWDYHIGPGSAAIDDARVNVLDSDIDGQARPYPSPGVNDIGADEYPPDYVVSSSPGDTASAQAGTQVTYTHFVTNVGRLSDTYTVTAETDAPGWSVEVAPAVLGPLDAQKAGTVVVTVSVPASAPAGGSGATRVAATSQATPTVRAVVTDTTSVACTPFSSAGIDYAPSAPETGRPVCFTGTVSAGASAPLTFTWAFGDGATALGQVVTHTYAHSATYTVWLTATNPCGWANASQVLSVAPGQRVYLPVLLR